MRSRAFWPCTSLAVSARLRLHGRETLVEELDVTRGRVGDVLREGPRAACGLAFGAAHVEREPDDDAANPLGDDQLAQRLEQLRPRSRRENPPRMGHQAEVVREGEPTRAAPRSRAQMRALALPCGFPAFGSGGGGGAGGGCRGGATARIGDSRPR